MNGIDGKPFPETCDAGVWAYEMIQAINSLGQPLDDSMSDAFIEQWVRRILTAGFDAGRDGRNVGHVVEIPKLLMVYRELHPDGKGPLAVVMDMVTATDFLHIYGCQTQPWEVDFGNGPEVVQVWFSVNLPHHYCRIRPALTEKEHRDLELHSMYSQLKKQGHPETEAIKKEIDNA